MSVMVNISDSGELSVRKPSFNHLVKANTIAKAVAAMEQNPKVKAAGKQVAEGLATLLEAYAPEPVEDE